MTQIPINIFHTNIEKDTLENTYYRKVINTTNNQQLVLMSLKPSEDISCEIHKDIDQFFRIEKGLGLALTSKIPFCDNPHESIVRTILKDGDVLMIPAGTYHQIINTSHTDHLKLYSIYSPKEHSPDRIDINRPIKGDKKKYKLLKIK